MKITNRRFSLLEVTVSLGLFAMLAGVVGAAMVVSSTSTMQTSARQRAMQALQNEIQRLQEECNTKLGQSPGFYEDNFLNNPTDEVAAQFDLPGPGPNGRAEIARTMWTDEDALPLSAFGTTAKDLNMDGDTQDTVLGYDLKLVPTQITITYHEIVEGVAVSRTLTNYLFYTKVVN